MVTNSRLTKVVKKPLDPKTERRHHAKLRQFPLGEGLPKVFDLQVELQDMWDVLLGREDPPVNSGVSTMMEVADAYYARANEIAALINQAIRNGHLSKGGPHDRFRTGELRHFIEVSKSAAALGSRRITSRQIELEEARLGKDLHIEG